MMAPACVEGSRLWGGLGPMFGVPGLGFRVMEKQEYILPKSITVTQGLAKKKRISSFRGHRVPGALNAQPWGFGLGWPPVVTLRVMVDVGHGSSASAPSEDASRVWWRTADQINVKQQQISEVYIYIHTNTHREYRYIYTSISICGEPWIQSPLANKFAGNKIYRHLPAHAGE